MLLVGVLIVYVILFLLPIITRNSRFFAWRTVLFTIFRYRVTVSSIYIFILTFGFLQLLKYILQQ